MNRNIRFRIYKNDIEISTNKIELSNSIGFAIFCNPDNQNILAEISRVDNDIKLISIMEKIDLSEVVQIIRNSSDENA